jgi:hypothetical protein
MDELGMVRDIFQKPDDRASFEATKIPILVREY